MEVRDGDLISEAINRAVMAVRYKILGAGSGHPAWEKMAAIRSAECAALCGRIVEKAHLERTT